MTPQEVLAEIEKQEALEGGAQAYSPEQVLREIEAAEAAENQGMLSKIGSGAMEVLDTIDSYTGAPVRAVVQPLLQGADVSTALERGYQQIGEDPSLAPTGAQIAEQAGVSNVGLGEYLQQNQKPVTQKETIGGIEFNVTEQPNALIEKGDPLDISKADVAGFGAEVVLDPLTFIPVVGTGRALLRGGKLAAKGVGAGARGVGRAVLKTSKAAQEVARAAQSAKKTVDNIGRPILNTTRAVEGRLKDVFKPTRVSDFDKITDILKRNEIDPKLSPESLEFGDRSSIATAKRVLMEGPLGDEPTKAFNGFLDKINNRIREVTSISGRTLDDYNAGELLTESYNNGVKSFFDSMDVTYRNVMKQAPDLKLSDQTIGKFSNFLDRKIAKYERLAEFGLPYQQQQAKRALKNIRSLANIDGSYNDIIERMKAVGEIAYKKGKQADDLPLDQKELRDIYNELRDVAINTVRDTDPALAKKLQANNRKMSQFLDDNKGVGKLFKRGDSPENVFKKLIPNGSVDDIKTLKKVIGPDDFDSLSKKYLQNLIVEDDGIISYKRTLKKLKNDKTKRKLIEMFKSDPDYLSNFIDLLEVGKRTGENIENVSSTDISRRFREFLSGAITGGTTEANINIAKEAARQRSTARKAVKTTKKTPKRRAPRIPSNLQRNIQIGRGLGRLVEGEND